MQNTTNQQDEKGHDANIVLAVSGLTECLTKFLREHQEYYRNDKEPVRLRQEMYIEIWATQFIAACASSAVDTGVSDEELTDLLRKIEHGKISPVNVFFKLRERGLRARNP